MKPNHKHNPKVRHTTFCCFGKLLSITYMTCMFCWDHDKFLVTTFKELRLILIEGDCSPKSPFLGATSAKSQKMESKPTLHLVSHQWRVKSLSIQSPIHQLPNCLCDSLFSHHHNNKTASMKQQQQ